MARSALFVRKQSGGMFAIEDESRSTGSRFYVDSSTGTDGAGYGQNPDSPCATIDYAVALCTANKGDIIYVMPGHAETINAASAIDLDIAGITVIGLGNGEDRPVITIGSSLDTATVEIGAADVKIKNLVMQPGNDGVDVLLDINADGAVVEDCELRSDETNAYQADTYIDINGGGANAADRVTLRRVKIRSITAGATQGIEIGAVEDDVKIEDCDIDGDFTAAGIHSASIFTNAMIRRNAVSNRNTGNHAIEFSAACTGMAIDNRMYGDTLGTIFDPGSLKCLGNLETDAIDQAGVDSPRVAAGGLPDDSITAASIATGAIDADAIADNAIDAGAIASNAITSAKIAANAIGASQIADAAIDAATFAAGAIDAAAIADAAIDAATFAAGAIDAAAIATNAIDADAMADGAITAATFAAGAIDAAAIADAAIDAATFAAGAIDAAAIANDAIDATAIAADAITNAKIADNALATEQFALSAGEKTTDGIVVTRAAAVLPQSTSGAIFTVTGHVLLKRILGIVTVELGGGANLMHLQVNSTGAGATTDICLDIAGLDVDGDVVDTMYEIDGTFGNAMIATTNLPKARSQAVDLVIPPGSIEAVCSASRAGQIRWSATYVPLEAGAQIVAA